MEKEWKLFCTALSFYTRLPVPASVHHQGRKLLPASIRYFPLIGWITGGMAAAVYTGAEYIFGPGVAILFAMVTTILMTGAFHEDGFADVCDGFGGGWTKEKILLIMKDSRLGTYGVTGLVLIMAIRFSLLQRIMGNVAPLGWLTVSGLFIVAQSLSRFAAMTLIFNRDYVGIEESKASGAVEKGQLKNLFTGGVFTLVPLLFLVLETSKPILAVIIIPVLAVAFLLGRYFNKWIGGYTGDCLGAVQQVTEVVVYLSYVVLWKFT
jgi:adenosylcobinamide-GDP ribazoletransferase